MHRMFNFKRWKRPFSKIWHMCRWATVLSLCVMVSQAASFNKPLGSHVLTPALENLTSSWRFTSTPRSSRKSTMLLWPAEQAQCKAVLRSWDRRDGAENDTVSFIKTKKEKSELFLPGLFCRRAIYRTGWTVLIDQTDPCRQSYRSPRLKRSPPSLNNAMNDLKMFTFSRVAG